MNERYLTTSEFKAMIQQVKDGKFNYKIEGLRRLSVLIKETETEVGELMLFYMGERERLEKENEELKKQLEAVKKSATGKMEKYQLAMKLGDVKPAYKNITAEDILELKENGYELETIDSIFDVSLSTIYRRLKEYRESQEQ